MYKHHMHKNLLTSRFNCSPKIFKVLGFEDDQMNEAINLGEFYFKGLESKFNLTQSKKLSIIQINIIDNYGNEDFTCLYRFKVF